MTTSLDHSEPTVPDHAPALALAKPASLVTGEDAAAYDDLLTRVSAAIKPNSVLEDLWVRDFVDNAWEVLRLRRYKAGFLAATATNGMTKILRGLGETMANRLAQRWAARELAALREVRGRLETSGLGQDSVMGSAFALHITEFDCIERQIATAEARRTAALQAIIRYRGELADQPRTSSETAGNQGSEFKVVEPAAYHDDAEAAA